MRINIKFIISALSNPGLIFGTALAVRFLFFIPWASGVLPFEFWDTTSYYAIAAQIIETGQYPDTAFRMPGYPLFLVALFKLFGPSYVVGVIVNIILGSLNALLTYRLGKRVFKQPGIAVMAGWMAALSPQQIWHSTIMMTEPFFGFLMLVVLNLFAELDQKPKFRSLFAAGFFLGMALLTRANTAVLLPVLIGWLLWKNRDNRRRGILYAAIPTLVIAVVWGFWIMNNHRVFHQFIPLTTQTGPGYLGIYNDTVGFHQDFWVRGQWENIATPETLSEIEVNTWALEQARQWIRENPRQAIVTAFSQLFHLWKHEVFIGEIITAILGSLGIALAIRKGNKHLLLWAAIGLMLTFSVVITWGLTRFRLFYMPLLFISTAYLISSAVNKYKLTKTQPG